MGVDKTTSNGVYDALINGAETAQLIVTTPYGDVLPSSKALAGAGVEMIGMDDRQFLLKAALGQVADSYDFIFIDCPPSLELLTLNALCAADSLWCRCRASITRWRAQRPDEHRAHRAAQPEPRAGHGGRAADHVRRAHQPGHTGGPGAEALFPGKVYATVIPRNVRLTEAPSHGKPITGL